MYSRVINRADILPNINAGYCCEDEDGKLWQKCNPEQGLNIASFAVVSRDATSLLVQTFNRRPSTRIASGPSFASPSQPDLSGRDFLSHRVLGSCLITRAVLPRLAANAAPSTFATHRSTTDQELLRPPVSLARTLHLTSHARAVGTPPLQIARCTGLRAPIRL